MFRILFLIALGAYFLGGCAHKPTTAKTDSSKPAAVAAKPAVIEAKKEADKPKGKVCVNGSDSRMVLLKSNSQKDAAAANKVCEVVYTKNSQSESVASSSVSNLHCEQVVQRIQSNLESGGFKCEG